MKIIRIDYKINEHDSKKDLKFTSSKGTFSHSWCFNQKDGIDIVSKLIQVCFSKKTNEDFFYVCAYLKDDLDHNWKIEINNNEKKIFKNENLLPTGIAALDFYKAFQRKGTNSTIESDNLDFSMNGVFSGLEGAYSAPLESSKMAGGLLVDLISDRKSLVLSELKTSFPELKKIDSKKMLKFGNDLQSIYWGYREAKKQKDSFSKSIKNGCYSIESQQINYKKQLQLISEVEVLHNELSTPGSSSLIKKEKLEIIENEINSILMHLDLDKLPNIHKIPNWNAAFSVLCKIQVLEKLVNFTDSASDIAKNKVKPLIEKFIEDVEQMVFQQEQYADEIESCISSVNIKLASCSLDIILPTDEKNNSNLRSQEEKIDIVLNWFDKMKNKILNEESSELKNCKAEGGSQDFENLETLRMSMEHILLKFSETRASLNGILHKNGSEFLGEINSSYDRQVSVLSKIKEEWKKIQTEFSLPENMSVKQLMNVALNYMNLIELNERKKIVEESIQDRKRKISKLAECVFSWRKIINSQKSTELENSAILLAEARGVIQYKSDRLKKIESQEAQMNQVKDDQRLLSLLIKRSDSNLEKWYQLCEELEIPKLDIESQAIITLLDYSQKNNELDDFLAKSTPLTFEAALNDLSEKDLNLWVWNEKQIQNQSRICFLNAIEKLSFNAGMNIFIIKDKILYEFMLKLGVGKIEEAGVEIISSKDSQVNKNRIIENLPKAIKNHTIQSKTLQRRIIKSVPKNENPKTEWPSEKQMPESLSPRAQAVLSLFNRKPNR